MNCHSSILIKIVRGTCGASHKFLLAAVPAALIHREDDSDLVQVVESHYEISAVRKHEAGSRLLINLNPQTDLLGTSNHGQQPVLDHPRFGLLAVTLETASI